MKLIAAILLCGLGIAGAGSAELDVGRVRAVRNNKVLNAPLGAAFVSNVVTLLRSCSVSSTEYAVKTETWQDLLRSSSFVHVTFAVPRKVTVEASDNHGQEEKAIDEILVPLPEGKWPAHIFAKVGTSVLAFTKYDPGDLKKVALEPALELSSVLPYSELRRLPDRTR